MIKKEVMWDISKYILEWSNLILTEGCNKPKSICTLEESFKVYKEKKKDRTKQISDGGKMQHASLSNWGDKQTREELKCRRFKHYD